MLLLGPSKTQCSNHSQHVPSDFYTYLVSEQEARVLSVSLGSKKEVAMIDHHTLGTLMFGSYFRFPFGR